MNHAGTTTPKVHYQQEAALFLEMPEGAAYRAAREKLRAQIDHVPLARSFLFWSPWLTLDQQAYLFGELGRLRLLGHPDDADQARVRAIRNILAEAGARIAATAAHRCAARLAARRDQLPDLTSDALLGLLAAIDHYDPGRSFCFVSFAVGCIHYYLWNGIAKRRRLALTTGADELFETLSDPDSGPEADEDRDEGAARILDRLTDRQAEILWSVAEYGHKATARRLGLNLDRVKEIIALVRKKVAALYGQAGPEDTNSVPATPRSV
jgi:RNA polymerase sigma factor (sigma-70 family)